MCQAAPSAESAGRAAASEQAATSKGGGASRPKRRHWLPFGAEVVAVIVGLAQVLALAWNPFTSWVCVCMCVFPVAALIVLICSLSCTQDGGVHVVSQMFYSLITFLPGGLAPTLSGQSSSGGGASSPFSSPFCVIVVCFLEEAITSPVSVHLLVCLAVRIITGSSPMLAYMVVWTLTVAYIAFTVVALILAIMDHRHNNLVPPTMRGKSVQTVLTSSGEVYQPSSKRRRRGFLLYFFLFVQPWKMEKRRGGGGRRWNKEDEEEG